MPPVTFQSTQLTSALERVSNSSRSLFTNLKKLWKSDYMLFWYVLSLISKNYRLTTSILAYMTSLVMFKKVEFCLMAKIILNSLLFLNFSPKHSTVLKTSILISRFAHSKAGRGITGMSCHSSTSVYLFHLTSGKEISTSYASIPCSD